MTLPLVDALSGATAGHGLVVHLHEAADCRERLAGPASGRGGLAAHGDLVPSAGLLEHVSSTLFGSVDPANTTQAAVCKGSMRFIIMGHVSAGVSNTARTCTTVGVRTRNVVC
jgi:hypothetical protein